MACENLSEYSNQINSLTSVQMLGYFFSQKVNVSAVLCLLQKSGIYMRILNLTLEFPNDE